MNVESVKSDILKQLENGFDPRRFETFIMKYLKHMSNNDTEVTKAIHYYDTTNRVVRIYIRTSKDTHNISFPMDHPTEIRYSTFEVV